MTDSIAPGLPDDVFDHDGLISKRIVRAAALAALRPAPGELLWDLGAGAGSVGIEWCRLDPTCRAVAVESSPERAERARGNAARLTRPGQWELRTGRIDDVLADLPRPDAVFFGGGATEDLVARAWDLLRPGGRLVVHGVTMQTDVLAANAWGRYGGELTRLHVETAAPIGTLSGFSPARAVTQWAAVR